MSSPVAGIGKGYSLVGHHEILIPLLAAALTFAVYLSAQSIPTPPNEGAGFILPISSF